MTGMCRHFLIGIETHLKKGEKNNFLPVETKSLTMFLKMHCTAYVAFFFFFLVSQTIHTECHKGSVHE